MTEEAGASKDDSRLSLLIRLDEVCDQFEAAWKAAESTGQRPRLEDYLGDVPEPERAAVLRELIPLDIDYRRRAGEQPRAEEYRDRFPFLNLAQLASTFEVQAAPDPSV